MTQRILVLTGAAALLSLVLAIVVILSEARSVRPEATGPLFPGIAERLPDVARIDITTMGESFSLTQTESGQWVMPEKSGYPADVQKARDLVTGLAEAERVAAKTDQPALYERIGVGAPAEDPLAREVRLLDGDGNSIAALIIGKRQGESGAPQTSGRESARTFVRRPDEARAWLATGLPAVPADPADWLDPAFLRIAPGRVQSVTVDYPEDRQGVTDVTVYRERPAAEHFAIEDMPDTHEMRHEGAADTLSRALASAEFSDVRPAAEAPGDMPVTVTFRTFDGLVLTLTLTGPRNAKWLTAEATVDEAVTEAFAEGDGSAAIPASGDVRAEAEELNARLGGWAYGLPRFTGLDLMKTRSSFITPRTEPESP